MELEFVKGNGSGYWTGDLEILAPGFCDMVSISGATGKRGDYTERTFYEDGAIKVSRKKSSFLIAGARLITTPSTNSIVITCMDET